MRCARRLLAMTAAASFVWACSDDSTGPQADSCTDQTFSVEATVDAGTDVVFDWTPTCLVALLLVEGDDGDTWSINTSEYDQDLSEGANGIAPPVTYGQVPSGILETWGPEPLTPGESYDLILMRIIPSGTAAQCEISFGDNECVLTVETFTR